MMTPPQISEEGQGTAEVIWGRWSDKQKLDFANRTYPGCLKRVQTRILPKATRDIQAQVSDVLFGLVADWVIAYDAARK